MKPNRILTANRHITLDALINMMRNIQHNKTHQENCTSTTCNNQLRPHYYLSNIKKDDIHESQWIFSCMYCNQKTIYRITPK